MATKRTIICFVGIALWAFLASIHTNAYSKEKLRLLTKEEVRADKLAFKRDYNRAISAYERLLTSKKLSIEKPRIELKLARLYNELRQYEYALSHYEKVASDNPSIFTKKDTYDFINIIRYMQDEKKINQFISIAEELPFYKEISSTSGDLLQPSETINLLKNDDVSYSIMPMPFNNKYSNFWIGFHQNQLIFISNDNYKDEEQSLFSGSRFYTYNGEKTIPYNKIKIKLQAGPATFSKDGKTMIYTDNRIRGRIVAKEDNIRAYQNNLQLVQLTYSEKRKRWIKATPLFEESSSYSFAHPALSNDGNTLYFSSNIPQGYGGMDLYKATWNNQTKQWENITNLGPEVNTAGDELFSNVIDNELYFASQGFEGYGGYDIYKVALEEGNVKQGSRYHLPSPINSTGNDVAYVRKPDSKEGYVTSDRRGGAGLDDIYAFKITPKGESLHQLLSANEQTPKKELTPADSAVNGAGRPVIEKDTINNTTSLQYILFSFDSKTLSTEAINKLEQILRSVEIEGNVKVHIVGYTDEIGSDAYNKVLSLRRAEQAAKWFIEKGFNESQLIIEGRGKDYSNNNHLLEKLGVEPELTQTKSSRRKLSRRAEIHLLQVSHSKE